MAGLSTKSNDFYGMKLNQVRINLSVFIISQTVRPLLDLTIHILSRNNDSPASF
jgi:hypothetical protein